MNDPIGLCDFIPISLIGCLYKIIAKSLVKILKKVIGKQVGAVQDTFIKGRSILDGVLVADTMVNEVKAKKGRAVIFKLDFENAFNSVK